MESNPLPQQKKKITGGGKITHIEAVRFPGPGYAIDFDHSCYAFHVSERFIDSSGAKVGQYLIKYNDDSMEIITEEEFNKLKEEGNHGI
jgi:hypothetical protein